MDNSKKKISPYSAAITGCGFMYVEMGDLLPMLSSPDRDQILRQEVKDGNVLKMKSEVTRDKAVLEFKRRYDAVPPAFWEWYQTLSKEEIRQGISDYATTNRGEFSAECFLEMQMPNPRPLAVKWWGYMERVLANGY